MICINDISVDCEWGDWVEGDCSATCGTGEQNNTRTKLVEEAHGGTCAGGYTNVTSCLVVECPGMYLGRTFSKKNSTHNIYMVKTKKAISLTQYFYTTLPSPSSISPTTTRTPTDPTTTSTSITTTIEPETTTG